MMKKALITTALTTATLLGSAAQAGHDDDNKWRERGKFRDYARVISVKPIVRMVDVSHPYEECRDEPVYRSRRGGSHASAAGEMILGGIIGGVIGNQVGHGRDRDKARVAGAVIGAAIGHDQAQQRNRRDGDYDERHVGYEQRCRVVDEYRQEERIEGYRVKYKYHGQIFRTRMDYDPGPRIPVEVKVKPVPGHR